MNTLVWALAILSASGLPAVEGSVTVDHFSGGVAELERIRVHSRMVEHSFTIVPVAGAQEVGIAFLTFQVQELGGVPTLVHPDGASFLVELNHGSLIDGGIDLAGGEGGINRRVKLVEREYFSFWLSWSMWADQPRWWDLVHVLALHNAELVDRDRVVTPASAVHNLWSANSTSVHFLNPTQFAKPAAQLHLASAADCCGKAIVIGGEQNLTAVRGIYGRFSDVTTGVAIRGVEGNGDDRSVACPLYWSPYLRPCQESATDWSPEVFVGRSGDYRLWNYASVTSAKLTQLHAFWVDAPLPPGVTVPP